MIRKKRRRILHIAFDGQILGSWDWYIYFYFLVLICHSHGVAYIKCLLNHRQFVKVIIIHINKLWLNLATSPDSPVKPESP